MVISGLRDLRTRRQAFFVFIRILLLGLLLLHCVLLYMQKVLPAINSH